MFLIIHTLNVFQDITTHGYLTILQTYIFYGLMLDMNIQIIIEKEKTSYTIETFNQ